MNQLRKITQCSFLIVILISVWVMLYSTIGFVQSANKVNKKNNLVAYNFGSLGKLTPTNQIALLKKLGYNGIILNSETKEDSVNLKVFLTELKKDRHFKIHAVMARYNFTEPMEKKEGWKTIVDRIAGKGIELWIIFGKKTDGITDGFIETKLREVVWYAKMKNVKVILYPHSKCVIASAQEALPFVQKINDSNLQLAVHLCHEIRAGNGSRMNEVFDAVKGYIGAITIAGTDSVADFSKPKQMDKSTIKPLGEGNFNMRNIIVPLRKSQYKGNVGFINFKIEDDPEEYLGNSIKVWRKLNNKSENY